MGFIIIMIGFWLNLMLYIVLINGIKVKNKYVNII
jgi:hypothetical protein